VGDAAWRSMRRAEEWGASKQGNEGGVRLVESGDGRVLWFGHGTRVTDTIILRVISPARWSTTQRDALLAVGARCNQ
jgi:hypothetical protein